MDHPTDQETAARQAAEQAWDSSPQLRLYYVDDKAAFVAQALRNAHWVKASPADQPELRA